MTLRYDRETRAAVHLCGGDINVFFPEDTYEIRLASDEDEQRAAEQYDRLDYVEPDKSDSDPESYTVTTVYPEDAMDDSGDDDVEDDVDEDICGAIKTNGEPCPRPADECRWHQQDDNDDATENVPDAAESTPESTDVDEDESDAEAEAEDGPQSETEDGSDESSEYDEIGGDLKHATGDASAVGHAVDSHESSDE